MTAATSGASGEVLLARTFVQLADTLVDDYDVVDLMDTLTQTCVDLLGATAAGLLLLDQRGGLQLVASSSEEARVLELFQLQNEQGPCLDCIRSAQAVAVPDLQEAASRWPRFSEQAARNGFSSVYAVPMRLREQVVGGLNIFSSSSAPVLNPDQQRIAQALADVATIGILQQRSVHRSGLLAEQLQLALNSRITIEQAKGVLSEQGQVALDVAYLRLRRYARDRNLRLSDVADSVVHGRLRFADTDS